MRVTNRDNFVRILSHGGHEHLLLPGCGIDVDLTADEAKALGAIFDVSGVPLPASVPVVADPEAAAAPVEQAAKSDQKAGKKGTD